MDAPKHLIMDVGHECGPPLPPPRHASPFGLVRDVPFKQFFKDFLVETPFFAEPGESCTLEYSFREGSGFFEARVFRPVYTFRTGLAEREDWGTTRAERVCLTPLIPPMLIVFFALWILWVPYNIILCACAVLEFIVCIIVGFLGAVVGFFGVIVLYSCCFLTDVVLFLRDIVAWASELAVRCALRLSYILGLRRAPIPAADTADATDVPKCGCESVPATRSHV